MHLPFSDTQYSRSGFRAGVSLKIHSFIHSKGTAAVGLTLCGNKLSVRVDKSHVFNLKKCINKMTCNLTMRPSKKVRNLSSRPSRTSFMLKHILLR